MPAATPAADPAASDTAPRGAARRRLVWSGAVAALVISGAVVVPSYGDDDRSGSLVQRYRAEQVATAAAQTAGQPGDSPHVDPPGSAPHVHDDPATKNAISRAGEIGEDTQDPTTAEEAAAATAYVAGQRDLADPALTTAPAGPPRPKVPADRYALANACYGLAGEPVFFKPTALGVYLLHDADGRLVVAGGERAAKPSPAAEWTARYRGGRFTFRNGGEPLALDGESRFELRRTGGCTPYPESQIDIAGKPHAGVSPFQEVRGFVDAHTHGMAFEFLGGEAHCGRPWHKYGAPYALVDCEDHTATGGYGAVLEAVLSGEPSHDPVGWPTFKDWPAPESLTHEGTYWRWLERAWRGGQRLFVNLLVENNQLCQLYPFRRNSCDDMDAVRLQAKDMYELQDYIDAQFGGPGRGFYRIVTDPWQAREVINAGQMAVVMGIETSVPFGCTMKLDIPQCNAADISRQLDEVHDLGVRQMELVNKFDNALSGVAGDEGATGIAVNLANFLETASFWDMRHCEPADGESHDKNQVLAAPEIGADQQDALFGAVADLAFDTLNLPALPLYARPNHCNSRGLTTLGEHTIDELVERKMLFDPDHMSVKARNAALDQLEEIGYPGVLSSHSWSTPDAYPRIYELGGFVAPYAGDSTGFVEKWRRHLGWADERFYFGFGFGADINGLGAQGDPRGADVANPVTYPFTGLGGVTVKQQRAGERVYDLNVDGVAQYGLYPDWVEDLRMVAGGPGSAEGEAIVDDMARGAEAYLQTWERAEGIAPDSCRNPDLRMPVREVRSLVRPGMTQREVMVAVGQPYQRLGTAYDVCARGAGGREVHLSIELSRAGVVEGVRRG
ncbi:peptidase [Nocardioides ferulae]|uniref:peptidase n=1 Tax=Nocardioides ferulae TaxID=2340821 RepID=UPI000EAC3317|nr:peptidase [Nocardioides ferulae]